MSRDKGILRLKIEGIIWLDDIVEKLIRKHQVHQGEVREVLCNNPHFRFVEKGHYPEENVYAAMGQTDSGRYLIIFFVYKKDKRILILSARDMTKSERSNMNKHISSISRATSYKETGDFWDVHEVSEFWDKTKEASFEVNIGSDTTYYPVDKMLSDQLQAIALQRGVTPETLVNLWVREKLKEQC
jgi:uncharacterized protein